MNYNKRETKILKIREENKIMETVKNHKNEQNYF